MAKKERKSGLGRGLESLIPKISDTEDVGESISLEDILKKSENETNEIAEDVEEEIKFDENLKSEDNNISNEIIENENKIDDKNNEKIDEANYINESGTGKKIEPSSKYTNVFNNDDEIIVNDEISKYSEDKVDDNNSQESIKIEIESEEDEDNINKTIDDESSENNIHNEIDEELMSEIIKTVENNPRITLWSAKSAAVLRYLRKTEPEFSISKEASKLIDDSIASKYPEIWELFNHL